MCFLNEFVVEEEVWVDFVHRWQYDVFAVGTVHDSGCKSGNEQSVVDVVAAPTGSLVEGFKVLSGVEELEQGAEFFTVFLVVNREEGFAAEHTQLESVHEFADDHLENSCQIN